MYNEYCLVAYVKKIEWIASLCCAHRWSHRRKDASGVREISGEAAGGAGHMPCAACSLRSIGGRTARSSTPCSPTPPATKSLMAASCPSLTAMIAPSIPGLSLSLSLSLYISSTTFYSLFLPWVLLALSSNLLSHLQQVLINI